MKSHNLRSHSRGAETSPTGMCIEIERRGFERRFAMKHPQRGCVLKYLYINNARYEFETSPTGMCIEIPENIEKESAD